MADKISFCIGDVSNLASVKEAMDVIDYIFYAVDFKACIVLRIIPNRGS